jgi:hypothetical protein
MNYTNPQPFDYLYIYEYESRTNKKDYNKISYQPIKTYKEKSELLYSFGYFVMNRGTQYIALQVKPNKYMEYLSINANLEIYSYELINKQRSSIYGLKYGKNFYIYIDMENKRKIKITFDEFRTNLLSHLYIYELNSYFNISSYIKKESIYIKGKEYEKNVSFTYTTSEDYIKQVALEITSMGHYDSLVLEFEYLVYIPSGIILLIVFICLCLIIVIILIYHKCNQRKTTNLNEVSMIQPLQPIDETPQEDYRQNQPCPPGISSETPYSELQQYNQPH